jgi:saccharopine dehydrogenase-like NADP-dependent oxidoreductase
MKDVVVIGAGKIGATVAGLLASTDDYRVTLTDRSPEVLGNLDRDESIRLVAVDVEDSLKLVDLLNGQFAVLNAAPFRLTRHIAEAARAAGTHYFDSGNCRSKKIRHEIGWGTRLKTAFFLLKIVSRQRFAFDCVPSVLSG